MEVVNVPSTLEVRHVDLNNYDSFKEPTLASYPRLANDDRNHPGVVPGQTNETVGNSQEPRTILTLRPKAFWIVVLLLLIVIAVAIGGSVGYITHHHERPAESSTSPLNSSIPSNTPIPGDARSDPGASQILNDTGLAAIAWNDTSSLKQYRLYHQDQSNNIVESAWNSSTKRWYITRALGKAKTASPIAAVVTGPQEFPFQINIYTLNDTDNIVEWLTLDGESWQNGSLTDIGITPYGRSNLAAVWHRYDGCTPCSNELLLVYEDMNGDLQLGNNTSMGWKWSTLKANPMSGTGLAMTVRWIGGAQVSIRVWYQTNNRHLCSLDWDISNPDHDLWDLREDEPRPVISQLAPIASFAWGLVARRSAYSDVLSSSQSGVTVDQDIVTSGWPGPIRPDVMANVQNYTSLAANVDAHVYAMENGTIKEFAVANDWTTWVLVGDVIEA